MGVERLLLIQTCDAVVDRHAVRRKAVCGVLDILDVIVVCHVLGPVRGNGDRLYAEVDLLSVDLEVRLEFDVAVPLVLESELEGDGIDDLQRDVLLGQQIGVPVYTEEGSKDPVQIAKNAVKEAKLKGVNVLIVDTAGRLAVDEEMMDEISALKRELQPQETLFVVDAMTGQDAVNTAKAFNDRLDFDGVVLTKLDGDTRGGAALTIRYTVQKPIKFVGVGEKMDALDVFHPDRMANRILGMGDVVSLVERAQEQYDEAEARKISKRLMHNEYNFEDFLSQVAQVKKMGSMKDLVGMIPGMDKLTKNVEIGDDAFVPIEAMIGSMTPYERRNPSCLNGSRKQRIAAGSGRSIQELNRFLKQFEDTRKMMKMVNKNGGKLPMGKRR